MEVELVKGLNGAVGEDHEISASVGGRSLDEPGLTRPCMRRELNGVERHGDIVDARVLRFRKIGIILKMLLGGTNPAFLLDAIAGKRIDPSFAVLMIGPVVRDEKRIDLRPMSVVLNVRLRGDKQAF